jgi:glycosyltransferase involved in cell wall biosynthesis
MANIYKVIRTDFLNKLNYCPMCLGKDIEKYGKEVKKENIFSTICWFGGDGTNLFRKGVDKALILFSELIRHFEYSNYIFYIIGKNGKTNSFLNDIVDHLHLQDNVVITDEVTEEEKYIVLSKSKYYFQLSEYEGFGLAALEALYFKNIVIHSNKGGLRDFMRDFGIVYDESCKEIELLIEKINDFNFSNIDEAETCINTFFSYNTRKNNIAKIIKKI